jgi:hypothetical protein
MQGERRCGDYNYNGYFNDNGYFKFNDNGYFKFN